MLAGSATGTVHAGNTGYWYAVATGSNGCSSKDSILVQKDTLEEPVLQEKKIFIGGSALLTCNSAYVGNRFS